MAANRLGARFHGQHETDGCACGFMQYLHPVCVQMGLLSVTCATWFLAGHRQVLVCRPGVRDPCPRSYNAMTISSLLFLTLAFESSFTNSTSCVYILLILSSINKMCKQDLLVNEDSNQTHQPLFLHQWLEHKRGQMSHLKIVYEVYLILFTYWPYCTQVLTLLYCIFPDYECDGITSS